MAYDDIEGGLGLLYGSKKFNDPFLLRSNLYIPKNFFTALEFALYLAIKNPLYVQATTRTVSHFITDVDFIGDTGSEAERRDLRAYIHDDLWLGEALQQGGLEEFVLGNSFARIHFPFNRYLVDRRNGAYRQISVSAFDPTVISYNSKTMTYKVPDPATMHLAHSERKTVDLEFIDRKSHDPSRIKIRFLDPKRMLLNMNFVSGTTEYIWRFDEFFRTDIETGRKIYQVNETPMEMLKAVSKGQDFVFSPGSIYHFKNPFISGLSNNGWGIPNILLNYNSIHQLQVLHCINEAVALDYILPFRLISPAPSSSGGGADTAATTNLGKWQQAMSQLIAHKRSDPTALHTVPFPVTYQELGQGGKQLAPVELLQAQKDSVLDDMGFPAELWHSSLQYQQVPTAIRAFESTYAHLYREFNGFTKWVVKSVLDYLERDQIGIKLLLPSVADNLELRQVYLQLASGKQISMGTALKPFNIDNPMDEIKKMTQEDIEAEKIRRKEQENYEREATLGSANQVVDAMVQAQGGTASPSPMPAAPLAGGGPATAAGGGVTPIQLEQDGEQIAMQMLAIQDNGERSKALHQIEATNPTLHAVVMRKMEKIRRQGASDGRKSVGQQIAQQMG